MVTGHREMTLTKFLTKLNISPRRFYTPCHLWLHFYYLYSMALNNFKCIELTYIGSDKYCYMCSHVDINMFLLC